MALGFSDVDETYEYYSEIYDSNCSLLGTSDDLETVQMQSEKHDESVSLLGNRT